MKTKAAIAGLLLVPVVLVGCGNNNKNNGGDSNYNESWAPHYVNGHYDPFWDYGLGWYMLNGVRQYNTPKAAPPVVIKNNITNVNPAPSSKPSSSAKPTPTTTKAPTTTVAPTKPKTNTPKTGSPKATQKPLTPKTK